ncbi:hypothetical protein BGW41_005579 [Actinomortierella wolfii]|nr:hypothetical protein BGW41_005579 [Actinomortierella wolfii]
MDQSNAGRRPSTSNSGADNYYESNRNVGNRMAGIVDIGEGTRAQRQMQQQQQQQQSSQSRGERAFTLGRRYADMNSDWIQFS